MSGERGNGRGGIAPKSRPARSFSNPFSNPITPINRPVGQPVHHGHPVASPPTRSSSKPSNNSFANPFKQKTALNLRPVRSQSAAQWQANNRAFVNHHHSVVSDALSAAAKAWDWASSNTKIGINDPVQQAAHQQLGDAASKLAGKAWKAAYQSNQPDAVKLMGHAPSAGKTLETITAETQRLTRKLYDLGASPNDTLNPNIVSAGEQAGVLPPGTSKYLSKISRNAYTDVSSIIPATGLLAYQAGRDVAEKGAVAAVKKDLVEPYKQLAEHPIRSFENNPVNTGLMVAGAYGAVGRGLGKAGRAVGAESANTARPNLINPATGQVMTRHYSDNLLTKGVQAFADRRRENVHTSALTREQLDIPGKQGVPVRKTQVNSRKMVPAEGLKPAGINPVKQASNAALLVNDFLTRKRFGSEARRSANEYAEIGNIGQRGARTLGVEAGPLGPGQFRKVGPLVKFADGTKTRMEYGTTLKNGKLFDPSGRSIKSEPVVGFREPAMRAAYDRRQARVKAFGARHTKQLENDLVGLVNRGVLSREALQSGTPAVLKELKAERDATQAALDREAKSPRLVKESSLADVIANKPVDANSLGLKQEPRQTNRVVAAQEHLDLVNRAIERVSKINTGYLLKSARKQAEASTRFQRSMVHANGLNKESAVRRPLLEAGLIRGVTEYDRGGVFTSRHHEHIAAKKEVRAAQHELNQARSRKQKLSEERAATSVLDKLNRAKVDAARTEGRVVTLESIRSRRLLRSVENDAKRLAKSKNPREASLGAETLAALADVKAGDTKALEGLMNRAAGAKAAGAKRGNREVLPSGRAVQTDRRIAYLRDKLADLQRSSQTAQLSERMSRVEGLKGEYKIAKVRAERARVERIQGARERLAGTREREAELRKYRGEKTTSRWVRAGEVGGEAKPISNKAIKRELRKQGVDPADVSYVSGRPNKRGAGNYFQQDRRDRAGYQAQAYEGTSTLERSSSVSALDLRDQNARINVVRSLLQSYDGFMRHAALDAEILRSYDKAYKRSDGLLTEKEAQHIQEIANNKYGVHLELVRAMRGRDLEEATNALEQQLGAPEAVSEFHHWKQGGKDALGGDMQNLLGREVRGFVSGRLGKSKFNADSFIKGDTGLRNVRLVSAEELGTFLRHTEIGAPGIPIIGAAFRRAVLPLSPKWIAGNFVEAELRKTIAGIIPLFDVIKAHADRQFMDALRANTPELAHLFEAHAGGGLLFQANSRYMTRTKTGLKMEEQTRESVVRHPVAATWTATRALVNGITDEIFALNSLYEHSAKRQVRGKAFQRELREFTGSWTKSVRMQGDTVHAIIKYWDSNPKIAQAKAAEFGRFVDLTLGKYSKFSPEMRNFIQGYAPFIAWYLNSLKFMFYVLPVKHPVLTGAIAAVDKVMDPDLKKWIEGKGPAGALGSGRYGIDTGADHMPGWFKTISGYRNGVVLDPNRLAPSGAFTDNPLKTLAKNIMPQTNALYAFAGKSPVSLNTLKDENNQAIHDPLQLAFIGVNSLLGATIVGYSQVQRLLEGGKPGTDNSTLIGEIAGIDSLKIRSKKAGTDKGAFNKVFNPIPGTYFGGSKSSGKSGGSSNGFSFSSGSSNAGFSFK